MSKAPSTETQLKTALRDLKRWKARACEAERREGSLRDTLNSLNRSFDECEKERALLVIAVAKKLTDG